MISKHKREKWLEFIKRQGKSPLSSIPFWKRINRLREAKRRAKKSSLTVDGKIISDSKEQANIFAVNLEKKFSHEDNRHFCENNKNKVEEFLRNEFETHFTHSQKTVKEFTMDELVKSINIMNSKTSIDPYGLSNKMFKFIGYSYKMRLLSLFNKCLNEKVVPKGWKHSIVSMLLKPGQEANNIGSYRPISMTPCVARLFERMILHRLQKHLKENNIIIMNQSGFRAHRQTKDNILYLIQKCQEGFNQEKKTLAIFFDIAAAFDKVWHGGLIYKLVCLKVPYYLITIIWAFLCERTFVVKVEGELSDVRVIICGVPQGGVLSPTLFSVYVNDVPLSMIVNSKTLLFADDIVFLMSYAYKEKNKVLKNAKAEAQAAAQVYLSQLEQWMSRWRLTLAPHKCQQITFSKARDITQDRMTLKLYNTEIPEENKPKFLGIIFDKKLQFRDHIESLDKKIRDRINILKILAYDKNWSLNRQILVSIYKVL